MSMYLTRPEGWPDKSTAKPGMARFETTDTISDMNPHADPPSTQDVLAGLVERVTYHNAQNGFCVLRAKAPHLPGNPRSTILIGVRTIAEQMKHTEPKPIMAKIADDCERIAKLFEEYSRKPQ
jgi:hypothetical protein